ncbi:MAG: type II toxin-antitoxin system RelE/ParE family toxin [Oscillospiraceae bacterium]|nr:type II toxin-antitoxin system RelE/ParE family toxin [Oscillospiraceae bacterium]
MTIRFHNNIAAKFIRKQPPKQQQRIMQAIAQLPDGDIKPLQGKEKFYRLRVGNYRVTFAMDYAQDEIVIQAVDNRGDVYKGL